MSNPFGPPCKRPEFTVGKGERRARGGFTTYEEIDRPSRSAEVEEVMRAAKEAGLWRFEDPHWNARDPHDMG